jgi:hypothetical protein
MFWLALFVSPVFSQEKQAPAPNRLPRFVINLVLGETEAGPFSPGSADTETAARVSRALDGLKGFLPYKRYALLDTAYLIGFGPVGPDDVLRGLFGNRYRFRIAGAVTSDTSINISFLRLWGPAPPSPLLIDASFRIAPGETVVVGTSRLDGGKALILLVTAVK